MSEVPSSAKNTSVHTNLSMVKSVCLELLRVGRQASALCVAAVTQSAQQYCVMQTQ